MFFFCVIAVFFVKQWLQKPSKTVPIKLKCGVSRELIDRTFVLNIPCLLFFWLIFFLFFLYIYIYVDI